MSTPAGGQTCYLHPDRIARISCQRCHRPICPADMREASVGFQCPPCVTAGAKAQRQPRTVLGGRISSNPRSVTTILIGINIAVYVLMVFTGGLSGELAQNGAMWGFAVAYGGEYWRLLTAAFFHSGLMHLGLNMLGLYMFGPAIEEALGRSKYLLTYLTLAVSSSVWIYWLTPPNTDTVGASGAIFGLFGLIAVFMYRTRQDMSGILIMLAINAVFSLQSGVSWQGHLGGFVTGVALGAVFAYAPRDRQIAIHRFAFIALWVAIVVATAVRSNLLLIY